MTGLYTLDSAALHARLGLLAALASARKNLMLLPSGGGSGAALQRLQLVGEIARIRKELGAAGKGRPAGFDHGMLNLPLDKRGGGSLESQIIAGAKRFRAKEAADRRERFARAMASSEEDAGQARALWEAATEEMKAALAEKLGLSPRKLADTMERDFKRLPQRALERMKALYGKFAEDAGDQAATSEDARAELDALTTEAQRRMAEAAESAGVGVALSGAEIDYLTPEEKARRHELLETLREPDSAEQARERVQERVKARKEAFADLPAHWKDKLLTAAKPEDVVTVEQVRAKLAAREGMFEAPQMRAEPDESDIAEQVEALKASRQGATTERVAIPKYERKVLDGLESAFDLLAQGWTLNAIGNRKQRAGAGGNEYLERGGQYMTSAKQKLEEVLKDAAFLEALKRRQAKPNRQGKSLDERLGLAADLPQAKRRNRPLEYTGYSGQARSVKSYYEAGGYRIAKPHEGLFEVIDQDGQAIHQMAGLGGALSVVQRLVAGAVLDDASGADLLLDATSGMDRLALLAELRRAMDALAAADDPVVRLDLLVEVARLRKALGTGADAPVVELTGDELGDFPDTPEGKKALRQAAIEELTKLRGTWLDCPALGAQVEIRKRGIDKIKSASADPLKLKIIPRIREILASATRIGRKPNYDIANSPSTAAYHTLRARVRVAGLERQVRIVVTEDDKGLFHYDHTLHEEDAILDSAKSEGPADAEPSGLMGGNLGFTRDLRAAPGATSLLPPELSGEHQPDLRIAEQPLVLNLFIEGELPGPAE